MAAGVWTPVRSVTGRLKWDEHVETGDAWDWVVPFTLGCYSQLPCLVIDCLLVASICYYSTNHMHLLMLSCRWQSSRRMRAHWTVLKTNNQASALISEEPGRERGSQVALEQEKVQPWTGVVFVYIYCPFGQYFEIETLKQYAERENTTDPL